MNITDHEELLNRIKILATKKATGIPSELAKRLDISERNLYRIIQYLRGRGELISYSRTQGTYYIKD